MLGLGTDSIRLYPIASKILQEVCKVVGLGAVALVRFFLLVK